MLHLGDYKYTLIIVKSGLSTKSLNSGLWDYEEHEDWTVWIPRGSASYSQGCAGIFKASPKSSAVARDPFSSVDHQSQPSYGDAATKFVKQQKPSNVRVSNGMEELKVKLYR